MSECNYTETPLPELRAVLMARHPGVKFDCVLSTLDDKIVQRICFLGRRKYLASFVPANAFKGDMFRSFCDEHGDQWWIHPEVSHRVKPELLISKHSSIPVVPRLTGTEEASPCSMVLRMRRARCWR